MIREKKKKVAAITYMRFIILYLGLVMAFFYGIKGEWGASFVGFLAAVIAFCVKSKKEKDASIL